MKKRHWYDYLWIVTPLYLGLGCFNILFAWLGLLFFCLPLLIAIFGGSKAYCNRYCDRGQFFGVLGKTCKLSRKKPVPRWLKHPIFRYGFLIFFLLMFANMLYVTWLVYAGARELGQTVTLFWTLQVPWGWAYPTAVTPWVAQFAFGFYSLMLTSALIGLLVMVLFQPRAWCVFCPMGTMTQLICRVRARKQLRAVRETGRMPEV